jgi:serine/threonine protein kinase
LGEDYSFTICPQCLFGEALTPRSIPVPPPREMPPGPNRIQCLSPLNARRDFFQKYEIIEKVGKGGQGDIWKVWDYDFHRHVAMKRLGEEALKSEPVVYRFLAEAQIASQLDHPGILPVFDVGLDPDGRPFYTTQLLPGTTLADVWRQIRDANNRGPAINHALQSLLRVCEVMAHAHSRGVIHRDLKPTNVLVGSHGDVRVIDWGSAKVLESARKNFEESFVPFNQEVIQTDRGEIVWARPDSPLITTNAGQPITMLFMPPEILLGKLDELGPQTDIYSMGVMLYELLSGLPPYSKPDGSLPKPLELRQLIIQGSPAPLRELNRGISRDLAAICQKAMAHVKSERYHTMQELADDMRAVLEIRPVRARKPGILLNLQKWAQRNVSYVLLGGVSLLIISATLSLSQALKAERDVARQVTALLSAELAVHGGHWREALQHWNEAEQAGYHDTIYLGLQRAEAWTVLNEPQKSGLLLRKLANRSDLGKWRAEVLLRLGEHELFDAATANQGVEHVRVALAAGLDTPDSLFAKGLLADSTPEALALFHQAIKIDSFHHGAQRHSLGLEFLLGRHSELQDSIRFFTAIYPDDPSPGFLEASELALHGRLEEARARMVPLRSLVGGEEWNQLNDSLALFAAAAKHFDPGAYLSASHPSMPNLDFLAAAAQSPAIGGSLPAPGAVQRMPYLPSIQKGLLEGRAALNLLMIPSIGNIDTSVARIKASWQHHPEAMVPMVAGIYLESRQPTNGMKSIHLLALQADLFQLAADSPSLIGGLDRTARYLATKSEFELLQTNPTNAAAIRQSCLANVQQALSSPGTSAAESKAYFDLAMELGEYDLAGEWINRWEESQPHDVSTSYARIDLAIATGNVEVAWRLNNQMLAVAPKNARALARRDAIQKKLADLIDLIQSPYHSRQ